jgi:hypothetical protein
MAGATLALAAVVTPLSASAATVSHTATAAAAPATVAVRSGWFGLNSMGWGYCLDSNAKGKVYVNKCQVPGNHYQDWIWTEWKAYSPYSGYYYFYSIKDKATGRCLDSNAVEKGVWGHVYTCRARHQGTHIRTGTGRRVTRRAFPSSRMLRPGCLCGETAARTRYAPPPRPSTSTGSSSSNRPCARVVNSGTSS